MMYRIKMMSGDKIMITTEEYQRLIKSQATGLVFIERLKGSINLNSVESILQEDQVPDEKQTKGRLHDGTRVIKKFGEWVDAASGGGVMLDYSYYPELARDEVMTEEEYQEAQEAARKIEPPKDKKKLK